MIKTKAASEGEKLCTAASFSVEEKQFSPPKIDLPTSKKEKKNRFGFLIILKC